MNKPLDRLKYHVNRAIANGEPVIVEQRAPDTCNTCGKPFNLPYRSFGGNGAIVQGCIDDSHTEHLTPHTVSYYWHMRPEAIAWRKSLNRATR